MILNWLRNKTPDAAYAAYTALVEQARQPAFYSKTGVPDTIDGRFDMIVMHVVLVFRRLFKDEAEARAFGQHIFDIFIKDMDRSLREIGVGDVSIPKKMKKIGQSYFGRSGAYAEALEADDAEALAEAIDRNIFPDEPAPASAEVLARYMLKAEAALRGQPAADLMTGAIQWPDAEANLLRIQA